MANRRQRASGVLAPGRTTSLARWVTGKASASSLDGLEHLDGDAVGTLRGDGERLWHEGRAEAHRRQAGEEMPPVERDAFVVHLAFTIGGGSIDPEKLIAIARACEVRNSTARE